MARMQDRRSAQGASALEAASRRQRSAAATKDIGFSSTSSNHPHAPVGEKRTQLTVLRCAARLHTCLTFAYPSSPRSTWNRCGGTEQGLVPRPPGLQVCCICESRAGCRTSVVAPNA